MRLSEEEKKFLTYCSKEENVSAELFEKLLCNVNSILNRVLTNGDKESGQCKRIEKMLEMVICMVITISAKENIDYTSFCSMFYEFGWNSERTNKLWSLFDDKRYKIRWNLSSSSTFPPQIIDMKWKLDYIVNNFGGERKHCLCYIITLVLQHSPGGRITSLTFTCSQAQLTCFITNLRKATRCIKNYSAQGFS
ncbi:UNVERIFIED_CONTAM: hypothetical protein RMT77_003187 [Armadillidium vulgare]